MGRRKGSKNKKTLEREAQQRLTADAAPEDGLPPVSQVSGGGLLSTLQKPVPAAAQTGPFLEYTGPDGTRWRIEGGGLWGRDFEAVPEDASLWHASLCTEPRLWRMVRLLYGVAPLVGDPSMEYLRPRSREEVTAAMEMTEGDIQAELVELKAFWLKCRTARLTAAEPMRPPAPVEAAKPMGILGKVDVEAALKEHGFEDLTRESDKAYAAKRLEDLSAKIDDDQGRPIAYRAIRMEIQSAMYDRMIQSASAELEKAKDGDAKIQWNTEIKNLTKSQRELNGDYLNIMKALDATQAQNPTARRKVAFRDCLSQLIEGVQKYHAEGNNELIDGIFREAEIKILTTPLSLRPAQYRPDIVVVLNEAMKTQNLFNPDYVPVEMDRGTYRRLQGAWREYMKAAISEDGVEIRDMEEGAGSVDDAAPIEALPTPPAAAPIPALGKGGLRPGEEFV